MPGAEIIGEAITKLTAPLDQLNKDLTAARARVEEESDGIAGKAKAAGLKLGAALAAGGVAAGALLVQGFSSALDFEGAEDKLTAQLGGGEWAQGMGKVAGNLYGQGFGDSVADTAEAVKSVVRGGLFPDEATDAQIQNMTTKFLTLSDVMDVDVGGSVNAVSQLLRTGLASSADEALDVITRGFQVGVDKSGDFLDTLNEYGTQFRKLGLDAETFTGILAQGLQAGARDSDLVADAIKEFSIRAVDGSTLTAQGFQMIGLSAKDMSEKIGAGGDTAAAALDLTLDKLRAIPDPVLRSQAAVALFGTQAEDLGAALYAIDPSSAVQGLGTVNGATDKLGEAYDNAKSKIEVFRREAMMKLSSFLADKVIPAVEGLASKGAAIGDFAEHNRPLVIGLAAAIGGPLVGAIVVWGVQSTIAAAKAVVGFVTAQASAVASIAVQLVNFALLIAGYVAIGVQALITGAQMAAAWLIGLGPIALVVAAVAGAAVLIVANWDKIVGAAKAVWNWISTNWPLILAILTGPIGLAVLAISRNWDTIKQGVSAAKDWVVARFNDMVSFITGMPGRVASAAAGMWDGIFSAFKAVLNMIIDKWNHFRFPSITFHIPHIPGTNIGGDVTFGGWSLPQIPRLATGGDILRGGLALVGEQGPELMRLPGAATVFNNPTTRSLLSGIGGAVRELEEHIHVSVDGRELFEIIRNRQTEHDRHTVGRTRRVA